MSGCVPCTPTSEKIMEQRDNEHETVEIFTPTKDLQDPVVTMTDPFHAFLQKHDVAPSGCPPKKKKRLQMKDPEINLPEPFDPNFIKLNVTAGPSSCNEPRACTQPSDDDESLPSIASITVDDIDIPDLPDPYDTDEATTGAAVMDDDSPQIYSDAGITTIQAVSMLLSWFATFPGVSKASFTRLLTLLHDFILPSGNSLPTSYEGAIRLIKTSLSVVKDYHCCVNDCVVFRKCSTGDYEKLTRCPVCKEDRYQPESNVPRKRFKYMPIETRVRRLFSNVQTSKLLQTHCTPDSEPPHTIDTIHQSKAWSSWYKSDGIFKGDCRALSFALCMDGLNPFAQEKTSYSTCPMTLVLLNFPHHIRMLAGSMLLTGLIPGPKEPKKTDAYVEVLVDDVLSLNKLILYDAYKKEKFQLKANVLLHIFDYPGQNKVLHCQGAGAYAGCAYCCVEGYYCYDLTKMVYLENRAFLPAGDVLCSDRKHFPSKDPVPLSPPQLKTTEFVDSHNGQLAAASTSAARHEVMRRSGCTGAYSLRSLPFHDRLLNTPVEPMHLLKNISERIVNIISGVTDTAKVRNEEKNLSRFKMSWVKMVERNGKQVQCIPEAPFSLKKNELIIANRRAMNIVAPSGIDWKPRKLFGKGVSHMKSVEWRHVVSSGILKFCIRGLLGREQRKTLTELCNVIHLLCAETVSLRDLDSIEYQVHRVLSLLERDFPVTIQVISVHLLHHLPMFVKRFGPLYGFWMYPMERFNSWIGRRVLNRRYPEATVMATYRIYEFTFFLELSGHLPIGSTTDVHGSGEDESLPHQPSDAETEHHNSDANHGCSSRLEPDAVKDLDSYYATTYPEYGHLLSRYKKEKCIAKRNKDIRCFPPLSKWIPTSGPPLSVIEMRLRAGPNDTVTLYKVYTTKDKHRRSVRYGSMIAETSSTVRVSSYVHLRSDQAIDCEAFGRIKYIFCSNFNGNTHVLAYIHWYKKSTTDLESGLKYFQLSSHNKSMPAIVPLTALSKPLIHALDEDNPDRLWIINC